MKRRDNSDLSNSSLPGTVPTQEFYALSSDELSTFKKIESALQMLLLGLDWQDVRNAKTN